MTNARRECTRVRPARLAVACLGALYYAGSTLGAQDRHFYVAEVRGSWDVVTANGSAALAPLARVAQTASVRYMGDAADRELAALVLRDPRTLRKARVECLAAGSCLRPIAVRDLRLEASAANAGAAGPLYATIANQEKLRERLRLVGARGDDRALAVVVLSVTNGTTDIGPILQALGRPGTGIVARFCALTETSDDCLDSRRILETDCDLARPRCAVAAAAYRVDVYARERTMLSTVAIASGFAALIDGSRRTAAIAERNAMVGPLLEARAEFGDDEFRALLAAATIKIAGDRP